jgi:signal transduction histidine kinase
MTTIPTDHAAMIERLSQLDRLRNVPHAELQWLAAHGTLRSLERGEFLTRTGDPREQLHLYIMLAGRIIAFVQRDHVQRKLREIRVGEVLGLLPFSRMTHTTADIFIEEPVEILQIDRELFPVLIRDCPVVTAACVHAMLNRAQAVTESHLHDEKLFSLGKLAAGLAHEFNNPASAVLRNVESLGWRQHEIEDAFTAIAADGLSASQLETLRALREECLTEPRSNESPMMRADREDAIAAWLEAHAVDSALANGAVDAALTIERLEKLAAAIPKSVLEPAIGWIAASIGNTALLAETGQAAKRIHDLVTAVKGFTQMDRPFVSEPTRIASGVRDTVAVMGPKARARSVTIEVDVPDELPPVRASAVELNQVWANLLDNALDAAPVSSRVTITAQAVDSKIIVRVVDQGNGIPEQIRGRIFDPFFTTKPVGQGRGLGLDTTRRIVTLIEGQIEFESEEGRTEFRVSIPIVPNNPQKAEAEGLLGEPERHMTRMSGSGEQSFVNPSR